MSFRLHPNLDSKAFILDLPLCRVLLEDNRHYPWIFLVPRRPDISKIMDLEMDDQLQLTREINWAQKILWEQFQLTQLNVAAIGNKTSQLHVHVIGRTENDPAWPGTVWDHSARDFYSIGETEQMIESIRNGFVAANGL